MPIPKDNPTVAENELRMAINNLAMERGWDYVLKFLNSPFYYDGAPTRGEHEQTIRNKMRELLFDKGQAYARTALQEAVTCEHEYLCRLGVREHPFHKDHDLGERVQPDIPEEGVPEIPAWVMKLNRQMIGGQA